MPGLLTILAYTLSVGVGLSLGDERHHVAAALVAVAGAVQIGLRLARGLSRADAGPSARTVAGKAVGAAS